MIEDAPPLPKPDALLALHQVTSRLFDALQGWFEVPAAVTLDLSDIDAAVSELGDPVMIVALAMRKLQALHLLATPGVRTTTDVVITIVNDLDRALVQAPTMRLRREAETTDWDAAFALLEAGDHPSVPTMGDDLDAEEAEFRALHAMLHEAVDAVIEASDGEIRVFE
jgi:hypothetical protein